MKTDLNEMVVFEAVARHGSFTRAAAYLSMPKSSVSRHISQLEEKLGERLLNRTTRTLKLTEAGKLYVQYCKRVADEAEAAQSALMAMRAQPAGVLKISAPLAFGAPLLQSVFNEFLELYPKVNMELHLDNRVIDLVDEEIDLAIRVGPLVESSLVARKLATSVLCLCASPQFIARYGAPETPKDLARFDVIKHPSIPVYLETKEELRTHSRFVVNDMGVVMSMAKQGYGVGVVPLPLAYEEITNGELVPLLLDYPFESRDFFLVYPSRKQLALKTEVFVQYMLDKVESMPHWNVTVLEFLGKVQQN